MGLASVIDLSREPQAVLNAAWLLRLGAEKDGGSDPQGTFFREATECLNHSDAGIVAEALKFATSIEYHHAGLSSRAYLAHPLRVATFILEEAEPLEVDAVVVALLHNVLEVSDVRKEEILDRFGNVVADSIETLTVDRIRVDEGYKPEYYGRLQRAYRGARIVKVLDKLDNVFMICFNPDEHVRQSYLDEIARWVQPIADKDLPSISLFLRNLTKVMRTVGYQDKRAVANKLLAGGNYIAN